MQNSLPEVKAPWVVGREALFEYAAEDFLHEVTRQQPWFHARYEDLVEQFSLHLDPDGLAPLAAFTLEREEAWLATLEGEQRGLVARMLRELRVYVQEWGWLKA